jgi:hypothetical protein
VKSVARPERFRAEADGSGLAAPMVATCLAGLWAAIPNRGFTRSAIPNRGFTGSAITNRGFSERGYQSWRNP